MYSIVLMMALSGSAEAPAFGHGCRGCNGGCHGCNGCNGGCNGCNGCNGCHGSRRHGCHGCNGCRGGFLSRLFHGCRGCHGCNGCNGGGCHGCNGGASCHGGQPATDGKQEMPQPEPAAQLTAEEEKMLAELKELAKDKGADFVRDAEAEFRAQPDAAKRKEFYEALKKQLMEGSAKRPARILVQLPADARLLIDGNPTVSTGSERSFVSPPLSVGKTYSYTLTAQVEKDGETVSVKKQLVVVGGQTTRVTLSFDETQVASK